MTAVQLGTKANGAPYLLWLTRRTHRLDLRDQDLIAVDLTTLAEAPNLQSFRIDSNPLSKLELAQMVDCRQLTEVGITAETEIDLAPLTEIAGLHTLHLDCRDWPALDLRHMALLSSLESLHIRSGAFDTLLLVPLTGCSKLRQLSLVNHTLARLDVTPLVSLTRLKTLTLDPMPHLLLDDVYIHHPQRIANPAIADLVRRKLCMATGSMTRIDALLYRLQSQSASASDAPTGMDKRKFWQIIEDARKAATTGNSDVSTELARRLWSLPSEDLKRFQDFYWQFMGMPDETVHQTIYEVRGGCSDDDFLDFRDWLIAQGQTTYLRVVENPDVLYEWGETWLDFTEGTISGPLYKTCKARGLES